MVRKVADIGYSGVETAGFPGTTADSAGKLFHELGLKVPGAHSPLPIGDRKNEVIETMQAIGCTRIINPAFRDDHYQSLGQIKRTAETFNEAAAVAAAHGMTLGIHNHWWEYQQVEGRYIYEVLLEHLDPAVFFEVDTYWVKVAGHDPAAVLRQLGNRAPLLHIKDGPADGTQSAMTAVGAGVLDWQAIIPAGSAAEWLIVELDRCDTDMLQAVADSYTYLTQKGYAHGRKN
jgi:sugar phosphate isomerase/epimerase